MAAICLQPATHQIIQLCIFLLLLCASATNAAAQQYAISTFAGAPVPDGTLATSAAVFPRTVARDGNGNIYFADYTRVYKISTGGTLVVVAGSGINLSRGDGGPATLAAVSSPNGLAFDAAGNLFISQGSQIRKVDATTGIITTIAGGATAGFGGDNGPAGAALLNAVSGIAFDGSGNLYIADAGNNRIRKIAAGSGVITTFAGTGAAGAATGTNGDGGLAVNAQLLGPTAIAFDANGVAFVADRNHNKIRKILATGVIGTVAGTGQFGFAGDNAPATAAQLAAPFAVAVDQAGNLYIADSNNYRIRKVVVATGNISTFAGNGIAAFSGDNGPAASASFDDPVALVLDAAGSLYVADINNANLRKITAAGIVTTVAGGGTGGDGAQGRNAQFSFIGQVTLDPVAHLAYIPEDARVRVMDVNSGIISTFAGNGASGSNGDGGPAAKARLGRYTPSIALDAAGNFYIADPSEDRIRKVAAGSGIISTVAGTGVAGSTGDGGPATAATLNFPTDIKLDSSGNIYIADSSNHRIRKIAMNTGIITTFVGAPTTNNAGGFSGDGGPAAQAQLHSPYGITFDKSGNLYIADTGNHRIRKVDAAGVISTVVGSDTPNNAGGFAGDNGPATKAQINKPESVCLDSSGNLFIAEVGGARIRRVAVNGTITTIAGTGEAGFSGDGGPATLAQLNQPEGITVSATGLIYVGDSLNNRVRLLTPVQITAGGIVNSASNLSGAIAPGEILSIYGSDFGPATGVASQLSSDGRIATLAGNTRVLFDGQPGPIAYTVANQVNVIAPYTLAGKTSTQVEIEYLGQTTNSVTMAVAPAVPGIYSYDSTGTGQAVLINQNATLNTAANPATRGSFVYFYATGEGQTSPSGVDGKIAVDPFPAPVLGASIKLGSATLAPLYAGAAPGFVAGVMQVNFQIPDDAPTGAAVPLTLLIGGAPSQMGITIAIR